MKESKDSHIEADKQVNPHAVPKVGEKPDAGPLLSKINSPADLRMIEEQKLPEVCSELRRFIIDQVSHTPGHFASSMGAVEIATALHYVFNTPEDRIVWDVGHQAYAHKILTGRRDLFPTLRTKGGISGFPKPSESEYDAFTAGHASNSISAALGMAIADLNTLGREKCHTVAVIGDASISGGLAFEGLNNASNNPNNLLIILNDNDMSIDDNVGALHRYLSEMSTSAGYNRWRHKLYSMFKTRGLVSENLRGRILRFNNSVKSLVAHQQNIFEGLNIRYFGPFDGNDVNKIVRVLREIKDMTGPRILHLCTTKGKGFEAAERDPSTWHAPGQFDPKTGERLKKKSEQEPPLWQDVFGKTLVELAEQNPDVMAITAAMPSGTSVSHMLNRFPTRTFDVGISEGHAVTFAGGLAASGKRPFVAIYSSFLQRAYDNIIHDVAIESLPVTFCIDRAGIVGEDGVTHHGLFDLSYLSIIPGMKIASPMDEATLRSLMKKALTIDGPFAIRYPRGKALNQDWQLPIEEIEEGRGRKIFPASDSEPAQIALLTLGPVGNDAVKAAEKLADEGIDVDVYDFIWLNPLDRNLLREIAGKYQRVITVEDGTVKGGFGDAVREALSEISDNEGVDVPHVAKLGAPAEDWVHCGTVSELRHDCGYDVEGITEAVRNEFKRLRADKDNPKALV